MFNMNQMMQQAAQMQKKIEKAKQELEVQEFAGEAAGGMVKATVNGANKFVKISIDDSLLQEDKAILEDIITSACNAAMDTAEKEKNQLMKKTVGNIPGMPPGFLGL